MKNISITKVVLALLVVSLITNGCSKQGNTGPAGRDGLNGNANVQAGKITLNASGWFWNPTVYGDYYDISYTSITQDVVDNGTVAVFYSNGQGGWVALPFTDYPSAGTSYTFNYVYFLNGLTLWLYHSNYANTSAPFTNSTIKIVAIGGAQKRANPTTNWNDYNEVMQVVNSTNISPQ